MQDLGDDTGSAFGRFVGRIADGFFRSRGFGGTRKNNNGHSSAAKELATSSEAEMARSAAFTPNDHNNGHLVFKTVEWDEKADIISEPLSRAGIDYSVDYSQPGYANFEFNPAAAPFLARLSDYYISKGDIREKRFENLEELRELAGKVTGTPWRPIDALSAEGLSVGAESTVHAAILKASSETRNEKYKTFAVDGRQSYELLTNIYAQSNIKYYAEWSAEDREGVFVLEASQFDQGKLAVEKALGDIEAGLISREDILAKTNELDAIENDRALLSFKILERDPQANILTNALKRDGINDWQVTTPDPEGVVRISIKTGDAPRLASIVDNYVGAGTVEQERFKNLDEFRRKAAAQTEMRDVARRLKGKSPAAAGENAQRSADARNRNRETTPPKRTQSR